MEMDSKEVINNVVETSDDEDSDESSDEEEEEGEVVNVRALGYSHPGACARA